MYYKQYGNTDIKVSAVGLGTMRYDEEDIKAGRFENVRRFRYMHLKKESITGIRLRFTVRIKVRL